MEGKDNCQKIVDILGLRTIFPLFMKPPKGNKRSGETRAENEGYLYIERIGVHKKLIFHFTAHSMRRIFW